MKFDTPATNNPIDQMKVVGKPTDRIDGPRKTTGTAPYAYERHDVVANQAYGYILGSAIPKGTIRAIDVSKAKAAPGVVAVVTWQNAGKLGKAKTHSSSMLAGPEIQHYDQAIALVVAEKFEQARAAARLIRVDYERQKGRFDLAAQRESAPLTGGSSGEGSASPPVHRVGDFEGAFAAAPVKVDQTYTTPDESHSMMEPHASIAAWQGDSLTLWTSNQMIAWAVRDLSETLLIPKEKIHVLSPFIGGGFGAKLWIRSDETATDQTRLLYAAPNRLSSMRLAVLDLPEGNAMRAPGEAPGMMALEIAVDEIAEKVGMDPVQFRIVNDTQVDPEKPGRAFSLRRLNDCLRLGADRFGWSKRNPQPAKARDGQWLVGMGVAAAFRNNLLTKSAARVRLDGRGIVTVETDMTDIGTGSYTIIAQTAAEMMGVPLQSVVVLLGDSAYPVSSGSGGQWGANNSTSGVYAACMKLRESVAKRLGFEDADIAFSEGQVRSGTRTAPLAQAARDGDIAAEDGIEYGDLAKKYQQSTFGAHFVEVGVDVATAEIRVRRMLAVCEAGRVLNPKSARSQVIGAMTMGVGAALMEELVVDKRLGYFVNHDLAAYEVPVHADIPHQDVVFLDETDPISSPMKAKGIAELGICGVAAAVANAVYNATGVRVRDYPITLDKLLGRMPAAV
jgi:xanthine dehydrogenase YagR molybdenum-binding subunit